MISTTSIEKAKQLIKKESSPIVVKAEDTHFNRKLLEYGKFDILLGVEEGKKKDFFKYLDSGLNHILAKIATKNNIAIGINLDKIKKLGKKEKGLRLGRIRQNIKICRKAKCKIVFINYKNKKEAFELMISLGASTKQATEAVTIKFPLFC
jgi:RNase P/RNase MRP subunit p30